MNDSPETPKTQGPEQAKIPYSDREIIHSIMERIIPAISNADIMSEGSQGREVLRAGLAEAFEAGYEMGVEDGPGEREE